MAKRKSVSSESLVLSLLGRHEAEEQAEAETPVTDEKIVSEEVAATANPVKVVTEEEEKQSDLDDEKLADANERIDETLEIMEKATKAKKENSITTKTRSAQKKAAVKEKESLPEETIPMQFQLSADLRYKIKMRAFLTIQTGTQVVTEALNYYFDHMEAAEKKKTS